MCFRDTHAYDRGAYIMIILEILKEAILGSVSSITNIAIIVIPLMIIMQLGRNYNLIDKISKYFNPLTSKLGMSPKASFPLLVGIIFGISYGAGVLIQSTKEGDLSNVDLTLLSTFLIICHALVEDTLLFVAIGANGWIVLIGRIVIAILMTLIISKRIEKQVAINPI